VGGRPFRFLLGPGGWASISFFARAGWVGVEILSSKTGRAWVGARARPALSVVLGTTYTIRHERPNGDADDDVAAGAAAAGAAPVAEPLIGAQVITCLPKAGAQLATWPLLLVCQLNGQCHRFHPSRSSPPPRRPAPQACSTPQERLRRPRRHPR